MTGRYNAIVKRLGHRPLTAAIGRRLVPLDRWIEYTTHGWLTVLGHNALPQLLLTTVGRRTGRPRTTPVLYARIGPDWAITASNWGLPHHPAWSTNLIAHPEASIEIGGECTDVHAMLTGGTERERLWSELVRVWPAYESYAARSGRILRVFRLTRRGEPDADVGEAMRRMPAGHPL
jgi:deazaflavin-dependent oxidoreductase (nitroreductase family)